MRHGLHSYVYNYGDAPVRLFWNDDREDTLAPGDSAYIQPMIAHRFDRPGDAAEGNLVVVRVPGALTGSAIDEFAGFSPRGRDRVIGETMRWF